MSSTTTTTETQSVEHPPLHRVPVEIERYPKLSREQAGHLRHFHNLASQPDGQWNHMGGFDPGNEFSDAPRYQLATMAYAASVAHYHRMPVLRSLFKSLLDRLIHKMLHRGVWGYWFNTSHSGKFVDPDLTELRKPWADPIVRENIMYSGHLLLMVSLYSMLFDEDKYENEGALEFNWDPLFWGMGPETFSYNTFSLQDAIMREMERCGYMGVCCEPNMIFIVCNQFPIIAIRYNDVRHRTNVVDGLLEKYQAAWQKKGGFLAPNGSFWRAWFEKQDILTQLSGGPSSAWTSAFMNAWNSDFVKACYDQSAMGFITKTGKQGTRVQPAPVARAFRELVINEDISPKEQSTLTRAQHVAKDRIRDSMVPKQVLHKLTAADLGYIVLWLSELGKTQELTDILADADRRLQPSWENGGLYYPRNDQVMNEDLEWTHMDPVTGNACIGYARLNVPDGQKIMYEKPWTSEILASRPWIDGVDLASGVDFLRATWDEKHRCLAMTMRTWDGHERPLKPVVKNLKEGAWEVYQDGEFLFQRQVQSRGEIDLDLSVGGDELDLVFVLRDDSVSFTL